MVAVALVGLWAMAPSADAADAARASALSISFVPAEVSLASGESADVVLLLQNTSDEVASTVEVKPATTSDAVTLTPAVSRIDSLSAGSSASVVVTVKRAKEGSGDSLAAAMIVTYVQGSPTATPITESAVASVTVKAASAPTLVTASFQGTIDAISEDRPADVVLALTNKRFAPVSITSLEIASPKSLNTTVPASAIPGTTSQEVSAGHTVDVVRASHPIEIAGRSTRLIPMELKAEGSLEPGQRLLSARVVAVDAPAKRAAAQDANLAREQTVATEDVKVEVFGESAILGALGVPLLLLLPGLIIITTLLALLRSVGPWRASARSVVFDVSKASLGAVLSVALSLLVAAIYPTLTSWWPGGGERSLRGGYGFADFYYIYVWSFALAVLAWAILCALKFLFRWFVVVDVDERDPWALLRKLALRAGRCQSDLVTVADGNATKNGLHVANLAGKWLLIPQIVVEWPPSTPAVDAARNEVADALKGTRLFKAWLSLRKAKRARAVVDLHFAGSNYITRLELIDPSDRKGDGGPAPTVLSPERLSGQLEAGHSRITEK